MLAAVRELGEMVMEQENKGELDILVEDPNSGNYKYVLAITLKQKKGEIKYAGVEREEYDSLRIMQYLYRKGSATGADFSPTARMTEPEKTFDNKILGWFREVLKNKKLDAGTEEKEFLEAVHNELRANAENIVKALQDYRDQTPKKEGLVVTLAFQEDSARKYVGDLDIFRRLLRAQVLKKDMSIHSRGKVCSLCGSPKELVLGGVNTYAFYTLDKPGFITGGFKYRQAWKNFPVCPDCKKALEEGKRHIEQNLSFKFYGLYYYLIPKVLLGREQVREEVLDILRDTEKIASLKERTVNRLTDDEDDILAALKDAGDTVAVNLLFLKKQQAAERILLLIEDVLPSRLRVIFAAKEYVDSVTGENFTFRCIRDFLSKSDSNKRNRDLDRYFLDITDRIFKDRPVDRHLLLRFIMNRAREEFVQDRYYFFVVKNGLMSLLFLEKLQLIRWEEEPVEQSALEDLFAKYGPAFKSPLKRGLFLLGSLTELLLRKQYSARETKPFMKNLKNLKMNERDFKGLLPKVQSKLEEYESFDKGKRFLAKEASNYLLMAGENWNMPVDEMNFCFAAGMNLADQVAEMIYRKEDENNGNH